MKQGVIVVTILVGLGLLAACGPAAASTPQAGIANPASVYCEQNGGRLDLRTGAGGGVVGICVYADASECEEWAYFRGECKPGQVPAADMASAPARLTVAVLQSAQYHSPDWGDFQLVDGVYHRPTTAPGASAETYTTMLQTPVLFGDLNGDAAEDAVVVLSTQNGGTGQFVEMAAVLNRHGQADNVSTTSLGDRVVVESGLIEAGVIRLDMRVHGPNDGLCCPSQFETWRFQLQNGRLVRLP